MALDAEILRVIGYLREGRAGHHVREGAEMAMILPSPPQTIDADAGATWAYKYSMFIDSAMKAHIVKAGTGALVYYTNATNSSFDRFDVDTAPKYAAGATSVDVNGIVYITAMTINNATKHIIAKLFIGTKSNGTYSWNGTTAADIDLSTSTTIETGLARNIIFEP